MASALLGVCCATAIACRGSGRRTSGEENDSASSRSDSTFERRIESRLQVRDDSRIFALFAFLNLAGYDAENNAAGMHPIRVRVRESLQRVVPEPLQARARTYWTKHAREADPWSYSVVAVATLGPPGFEPSRDWTRDLVHSDPFDSLGDLPPLLRELWAAAPIESLYTAVHPEQQRDAAQYEAAIAREVAAAFRYARTGADRLGSAAGARPFSVVIPSQLISYEHAFSFVLSDTFFSIEGPQKSLGYNPHEFVHSITNPLSDAPRWEALQARAQPLFDAVRELPEQVEMRSIAQLFDECLVRAIVLRYDIGGDAARTARREAAMRQEYLAGFILERFFFEALAAYEMTSESLADFYPKMLEQLDPAVELARWRAARSAAKR